jgi:hypothetical protein
MQHDDDYQRAVADQISKVIEPLGYRVRKQMEAAEEMGLTHDDLRAVYKRRPEEYGPLLTALGVTKEEP